jgi:diguanylate cyclase (GGDEF)-like protein/PAS domain S-box-containing protein
MLRVYDCIAHEHDPQLVALAVLIALAGAHTTIRLLRHVATLPLQARRLWLAAAALAAGAAIWATHFVAMLAFRPGVPVRYDAVLTVLSFLVAVIVSGTGAAFAVSEPGWRAQAAGGAIIGLGIAVMHYLGMAALVLPGTISWDTGLVVASTAAACVLSAAAMVVALHRSDPWRGLAGSGLFALAACAAHFTGMAAAELHLGGTPGAAAGAGGVATADGITPRLLAFDVAFVCAVILAASLAVLELDRRAARRRAEERENLRNLADIAVEGLAICDGDRVVAVNRSLEQMTGRAGFVLRGATVADLFDPAAPASDGMAMLLEKAGERMLATAGGAPVPVEVMRKPITFDGRPHQVLAFRDLRERRKAEAEIRFLAHHDPLTGLCNRAAFAIALENQFQAQSRDRPAFALLGVDLDRFKTVNDTLGHPLGDVLLRRVADRLRATVREPDVIARIGGDEFSVLMVKPATPASVAALAQRIVEMLRRPYVLDGEVAAIGASVGIALAPQDGADPVALMKSADLALYRAKAEGRNRFVFFEPGIHMLVQTRRAIEAELRRALRQDELEVYYQPLFDIAARRVCGFEALARWRHPERGLLLPADFIAVAEESGLIVKLGRRVLDRAVAQAVAWGGGVSIAVNLSAMQFADGQLVATVREALRCSGLDPRRLELEITESVLLRDSAATLATLHELRDLGVRISMDDFGTGYSSLRYLRSFPFDKIKIDQSFVQEMLSNAECAAIIDAVIGIGRRLGIVTTAEGVETEAQLRRLIEEGCDMAQGYLIGRPEPAGRAGRHLNSATWEDRPHVSAPQEHA